MRSQPERLFEQHLWQESPSLVAGVDEVGVGAWAGPVIAAAVILPRRASLDGLNDSKLLTLGGARCCSKRFGCVRWPLG
jgi:ribonuclease HII